MKNIVNRMVLLFVVATITSAAALANTSKKQVTFADAVTVNGVIVKQGTYEVRFDDQSNQLTIARGTKVIAQAAAQLEKREGPGHTEYVTRSETNDTSKPPVLLSISLKGGNQATLVNTGD
jgi:hypothetical protein